MRLRLSKADTLDFDGVNVASIDLVLKAVQSQNVTNVLKLSTRAERGGLEFLSR